MAFFDSYIPKIAKKKWQKMVTKKIKDLSEHNYRPENVKEMQNVFI